MRVVLTNWLIVAAAVSCMIVPLAGCERADGEATPSPAPAPASEQPTPDTHSVVDDMARTVTVPKGVSKVAALAPFVADMLIELDIKPVLVPVIMGEAPAAWAGIPTAAVDHSAGPNIEQIVAAKPDLIVITSVYAQFLPKIESLTTAPILVMDVDAIDDVSRHLQTLGELTGKSDRAKTITADIEKTIAANAPAATTTDADRTDVLAVFGTPHAFYAFLPESYLGDLVRLCGGRLMTEEFTSHKVFKGLAPLSMETIVAKNPDVILILSHGPSETIIAMLAKDAAWGSLDAVKNGRVRVLPEDLFVMHPGSRAVEAIGLVRQALHTPAQ